MYQLPPNCNNPDRLMGRVQNILDSLEHKEDRVRYLVSSGLSILFIWHHKGSRTVLSPRPLISLPPVKVKGSREVRFSHKSSQCYGRLGYMLYKRNDGKIVHYHAPLHRKDVNKRRKR